MFVNNELIIENYLNIIFLMSTTTSNNVVLVIYDMNMFNSFLNAYRQSIEENRKFINNNINNEYATNYITSQTNLALELSSFNKPQPNKNKVNYTKQQKPKKFKLNTFKNEKPKKRYGK